MPLDQHLTALFDQLMVGCVQLTRFHEMTRAAAQQLDRQAAVPDAALSALRHFLDESRDESLTLELEDTGETLTLSREEAAYLFRLTNMGLDIEVRYPRIANEMMLIYVTTLFEAYVLDATRAVMQSIAQPLRRGGRPSDGSAEIGEETSRVLVRLIRRQVRDLEFRSIQVKLGFLEDTLGVSMADLPGTPADLNELYATRNLLVHNRGVVNRRYVQSVRSTRLRVGEIRRVDDEYVRAAITTVRLIGEHLHRGLLDRYVPEAKARTEDAERLMRRLAELLSARR